MRLLVAFTPQPVAPRVWKTFYVLHKPLCRCATEYKESTAKATRALLANVTGGVDAGINAVTDKFSTDHRLRVTYMTFDFAGLATLEVVLNTWRQFSTGTLPYAQRQLYFVCRYTRRTDPPVLA